MSTEVLSTPSDDDDAARWRSEWQSIAGEEGPSHDEFVAWVQQATRDLANES